MCTELDTETIAVYDTVRALRQYPVVDLGRTATNSRMGGTMTLSSVPNDEIALSSHGWPPGVLAE